MQFWVPNQNVFPELETYSYFPDIIVHVKIKMGKH